MIFIEILQTTMSDYISTETVAQLYEKAGSMTEEDAINVPLDNYSSYLLNDHVHSAIQQVLLENPLPYQLQEFQLAALHCLGSLKNVILITPTGSGKMLCVSLGILVLKKLFGLPKGVGLVTQPLRLD